MIGRALVLTVLILGVSVPARAIDHKNLDEGRPTRLDDAYTIATGEIELETGLGVALGHRGAARGAFPIEVLYGALPNLQLGVGATLTTDPRDVEGADKSGNVRLGMLYNFNQETLTVPAFGVRLDLGLPTGVGAESVTVKAKGIVTRSVERVSLHLNAAYEFVTEPRAAERSGHYELVLGASYPIGAPQFTRATVIADVFTEQGLHRGEENTVGLELGLRYQLTPRWVWEVGVATEFVGPRDRSPFSFTTGLSVGF
jgi:hypothetical protein